MTKKIAMFWDYDPNQPDQWCTPYGIYSHLKNVFRYEMRQYCTLKGDKTKGFRDYLEDDFQADALVLFNAGPLPGAENYWNKEVMGDALLIQEAGDEPQCYNHTLSFSTNSDLVLTPDLRCVEMYETRGVNVEWMTHWCDEKIFFDKPDQEITNDVVSSMCGGRQRASVIQNLVGPEKFKNATGLIGLQNGEWLRTGKIILQDSRYDEITRRIFEGMGCKRMVLTDRISKDTGLEDLFVDREDIVYYDSPEHAVELIEYYLKNDSERERIAENGYLKVMEGHTSLHRADQISQFILSN